MEQNKQYDLCVIIGRFNPPTKAHIANIEKGLEIATRVLVLIGSPYQPRTIKNPFTYEERAKMLRASITNSIRMGIRSAVDILYDNTAWCANVQQVVHEEIDTSKAKIAILGHKKDASSFYLDMFPQWDFVSADVMDGVHATEIRNEYFSSLTEDTVQDIDNINLQVESFLYNFSQTEDFKRLHNELRYIQMYKKSWEAAPYPVNLVCADACVIKSGHVLLVKRKSAPGEGLLALPGGYVNVDETVKEAMIRELREETGLKVPVPVLLGSIQKEKTFDHPNRSLRGRVITTAYLVNLGHGKLDRVKGGDDAETAFWKPLSELDSEEMFEDHMDIIMNLVGGEK